MQKILTIAGSKRSGNILAVLIIFILALLSVIRLYPFENTLPDIVSGTDDWSRYARTALEIKNNGILIPNLTENYFAPGGFLYNYFIAACFYCFGENTVPVYFIQSILLGVSVALTYWTFRDKMKPVTAFLFLLTLFLFALLDVYEYYTFRFLSENLAVFTVSAFLYCFIKGTGKNKLSLLLASAMFMGFSILTRPNIFPFSFVLILMLAFYFWKQGKKISGNIILFSLVLFASTSFLMIRNHIVCGSWTFLPTEGLSFGEQFFKNPNASFTLYFKKIFYFFGILPPLDPDFHWRPHWTLMFIGYFVYLYFKLKERNKFEIWELTTHLFIVCYYGVLLLIGQVESYGFRLLIPITFTVLPFSLMAVDRLKTTHHHNH